MKSEKKIILDDLFAKLEKDDETIQEWNRDYEQQSKFIEKLVSLRKKKKVTQKQLAEMTGLKQAAIARFESMENSPRLETIFKIVKALNAELSITCYDFYSHDYLTVITEQWKKSIEDLSKSFKIRFESREINKEGDLYDYTSNKDGSRINPVA